MKPDIPEVNLSQTVVEAKTHFTSSIAVLSLTYLPAYIYLPSKQFQKSNTYKTERDIIIFPTQPIEG